jgi:hypothetical protein
MADLAGLMSVFMMEQAKLLTDQAARLNALAVGNGDAGKKKKKRDPNAPKKPASSYLLFMSDFTPQVKMLNPNMTQKEVMAAAGHRWSQLPADKKVKYEQQAAQLKAKYMAAMEAYKASLVEEDDEAPHPFAKKRCAG